MHIALELEFLRYAVEHARKDLNTVNTIKTLEEKIPTLELLYETYMPCFVY